MPFFSNTTGPVTITDSQMKDIQGDYYHDDRSTHTTNTGSHNRAAHDTRNSYNNLSTTQGGNEATYHNNVDGRSTSVAFGIGKGTHIQPHLRKDAQFPSGNAPERESQNQPLRENDYSGNQNLNSSRGAVNNLEENERQESVGRYLNRRSDDMDVDAPGGEMQSTHLPQTPNSNTHLADHRPPPYTA